MLPPHLNTNINIININNEEVTNNNTNNNASDNNQTQITLLQARIENLKERNAALVTRNKKLMIQNSNLILNKYKKQQNNPQKKMFKTIITTDKKCNFYTNVSTIKLFHILHDCIQPLVYRRFYKNNVNTFYRTKNNRTPKKSGPTRKLCSQDEFLLVLMKLRLALFNKDLADLFKICFATVSKIFQSWIRAMAKYISSIVYMPEEMQIRENLPERFENKRNVVAIIDCSEIFIETPKNLELQSTTWSEYKHHNTMKFLISVTPSSFINYVSEAYTGRISDKALTNDCNFFGFSTTVFINNGR